MAHENAERWHEVAAALKAIGLDHYGIDAADARRIGEYADWHSRWVESGWAPGTVEYPSLAAMIRAEPTSFRRDVESYYGSGDVERLPVGGRRGNLPTWPGASAAYSRAYRNLEAWNAREAEGQRAVHRRAGRASSTFRYSPPDEIRDYVKALDQGDEETVKWWNLHYDQLFAGKVERLPKQNAALAKLLTMSHEEVYRAAQIVFKTVYDANPADQAFLDARRDKFVNGLAEKLMAIRERARAAESTVVDSTVVERPRTPRSAPKSAPRAPAIDHAQAVALMQRLWPQYLASRSARVR